MRFRENAYLHCPVKLLSGVFLASDSFTANNKSLVKQVRAPLALLQHYGESQ